MEVTGCDLQPFQLIIEDGQFGITRCDTWG